MASNRADDVKRRFTNIVNSPELRSRAHGRDRAASLVEQIVASCHPKQRAFVEDPSKEIAALVGRGGGKTTGGRARLLKQCLTVPRSRCLYIATTRSQAERFMWGPLLQINEQLQLGCMPLISKLRIDFPNGSFIQLGGCDDRKSIEKWRGEPFHEVHIDEAATHTVQILSWLVDRIIGPRLGDYDGAIILYGTPGHILAGLFYDTTREQSELSERYEDRTEGYLGWSKHDWTLEDAVKAGVPAAISLWKRALRTKALNGWSDDHPVWRREYLGKWAADDTEGVYRYRPHLEDGTEWNQWNPEMDSMGFAKLPPGEWLYTYGFDMGHSDPFALEIFAHNSETSKLLHVYEFNQKGMKVRDIAELLVGKRWVRLILLGQDPGAAGGLIGRTGWPYGMVADIAGLGGAILDELRDVYGIPIEAADKKHKHDSIELTNGDLLDGRIKVLKGSVLEEQLMALQWAVDQWGKLKEDKGARNDACDALLYLRRKAMLLIGHEAEAERPDPKSQEALDAWESESIAQAIREEKAKDDEFGFGDMAGLEYTEYTDDW